MGIHKKTNIFLFFSAVGVFLFMTVSGQDYSFTFIKAIAKQPVQSTSTSNQSQSIFDFTMKDIDGKEVPLSQFKGKVIMLVNTASFCGNTPQYGGLQTLYENYRDQGFTILAFPANDFGKQEPGTDTEIAEFCYTKYSLEFPLIQ